MGWFDLVWLIIFCVDLLFAVLFLRLTCELGVACALCLILCVGYYAVVSVFALLFCLCCSVVVC